MTNYWSNNLSVLTPPLRYAVTFTEAGLPLGTPWTMTLNGTSRSGTGSSVALDLPNGTYVFAVGSVGRYLNPPGNGLAVVQGSSISISTGFNPANPGIYLVTFTQSGLPLGWEWEAGIGTLALTQHVISYASIATVAIPNGTWAWSVTSNVSYDPWPNSQGSVTVSGQSVVISVDYTLTHSMRT